MFVHLCSPEEGGCEAAESLLPCSIPQLQMNPLTTFTHACRGSIDDPFFSEVDADSRNELVAEFVVSELVQETGLPHTGVAEG